MKLLLRICIFTPVAFSLAVPTFSRKAAMPEDFADPSLIQEPNGQYWSFGSSNGLVKVPVARSPDFLTWQLQSFDALPDAGLWTATDAAVLAPDVNRLKSGKYIMYYSAALGSNSSIYCVGAATSDDIKGPYIPFATPFLCPQADGGASEPSAFRDPFDDSLYVLYKINGNALVPGGLCGNESPTQVPRATPIMIQQVNATDGQTLIGAPQIILQRGSNEGPTIGSPSLTSYYNPTAANGYAYFLFYSSGCSNSVKYATRYATNIVGPSAGLYVKVATPLMKSGDGKNLHSPASLDISGDADHALFTSYEYPWVRGRRQLRTARVNIVGLSASL